MPLTLLYYLDMTESLHNQPETVEFSYRQASDFKETPNNKRPVEIIHNPGNDIIINNTSPSAQEWGSKLAQAWHDGRPLDWDISMSLYPHENLAVGTIDGKQFFAKKRLNRLRSEFDAEAIKQLRHITGEEAEKPAAVLSEYSKNTWYSFESLLNEMRMAPIVREVVNTTETQNYFHNHGFKGMTLVEPIAAVIDRVAEGDPHKTTIYEYIPEATGLEALERAGQMPASLPQELTDFLHAEFAKNGIMPSDLQPRQILMDQQRQLYLIDIEGYHMRQSNSNRNITQQTGY